MRKLYVLLTVGLVAFGFAGNASAKLLNWEGTTILLLGDLAPGVLGGGGVATINGSGGGTHVNSLELALSRGQVQGSFIQPVTDPDTVGNGIAAVKYENIHQATGTFSPISGGAASTTILQQNQLALGGVVKICLLSTACTSFLELILSQQSTVNGVVTSTKAVGVGGLLTIGGQGAIRISIEAAPWTIKTASMLDQITTTGKVNQTTITVTLKGFAHGVGSGTTNTATPSGVVQLVTPTQVVTNLPFGSNAIISSGATTTYHFIPEPGLLLLLGSGVAGLTLLGRSRFRSKK